MPGCRSPDRGRAVTGWALVWIWAAGRIWESRGRRSARAGVGHERDHDLRPGGLVVGAPPRFVGEAGGRKDTSVSNCRRDPRRRGETITMARTVQCVKLREEAEGLDFRPCPATSAGASSRTSRRRHGSSGSPIRRCSSTRTGSRSPTRKRADSSKTSWRNTSSAKAPQRPRDTCRRAGKRAGLGCTSLQRLALRGRGIEREGLVTQVSGFKMPESGRWIPAFAGMTASLKATRLAEMTSFPRKRESISVSESET